MSSINTQIEHVTSCASLVIEHRVLKTEELEFEEWQSSLTSAVDKFAGYLRTDTSPPVTGVQDKWYIIVYFDTQENLNKWVDSPERQALVKKGEELFGSYKYRSFKTGLESWFATESNEFAMNTPAWKQNLIVLLGLYPTVMAQTLILSGLKVMDSWPLSVSMLINNFICCSLLTWVVMPPLSRWFEFWLKDQQIISKSKNFKGLAILMGCLAVIVAIFYTTSDSDPGTVLKTLQTVPKRLLG